MSVNEPAEKVISTLINGREVLFKSMLRNCCWVVPIKCFSQELICYVHSEVNLQHPHCCLLQCLTQGELVNVALNFTVKFRPINKKDELVRL